MSTPLPTALIRRAVCIAALCLGTGAWAKAPLGAMSVDPCPGAATAIAPAALAAPKPRVIKRVARPVADAGIGANVASPPKVPRVVRPRPRAVPVAAAVPALPGGCGAASPLVAALGQLVPAVPVLGRSEMPSSPLPILAGGPATPGWTGPGHVAPLLLAGPGPAAPTVPTGPGPALTPVAPVSPSAPVPPAQPEEPLTVVPVGPGGDDAPYLPVPVSPFGDTEPVLPATFDAPPPEGPVTAEVPEPATLALILLGILAAGVTRRRRAAPLHH